MTPLTDAELDDLEIGVGDMVHDELVTRPMMSFVSSLAIRAVAELRAKRVALVAAEERCRELSADRDSATSRAEGFATASRAAHRRAQQAEAERDRLRAIESDWYRDEIHQALVNLRSALQDTRNLVRPYVRYARERSQDERAQRMAEYERVAHEVAGKLTAERDEARRDRDVCIHLRDEQSRACILAERERYMLRTERHAVCDALGIDNDADAANPAGVAMRLRADADRLRAELADVRAEVERLRAALGEACEQWSETIGAFAVDHPWLITCDMPVIERLRTLTTAVPAASEQPAAFWQSVGELAAMRNGIPAERRSAVPDADAAWREWYARNGGDVEAPRSVEPDPLVSLVRRLLAVLSEQCVTAGYELRQRIAEMLDGKP